MSSPSDDGHGQGMAAVASPHWLASAAGKRVLQRGGNALDACIAMNAVLAVAYPHMCGLGGDLFLLYYEASSRKVFALNGSGRAPMLASREEYLKRGLTAIPVRGPLSATVPGAVHAWETALARFGTLDLKTALEPAIGAAQSGVAVTPRLETWITRHRSELAGDPSLRKTYLDPEGSPLTAGDTLRMPELATTLERIADVGASDFYTGALARAIDRAMREADGLLRLEDLTHHKSEWVDPITTTFGGASVHTTPPNSQGIVALEMLNLLELWKSSEHPVTSAEYVDEVVRAKAIAFADRDRYLGDPHFVDVPVAKLLSDEHTREVARMTPSKRTAVLSGDTVYMCAIDGARNACSLIQSIYYGFGSTFSVAATGVVLHNRGHYFSLDERHPNCLRPGKRPAHTLMPCIGLRRGEPALVLGTMGADGQPQTVTQVLVRLVSGEHPQKAVSEPRFLSGRFLLEDPNDGLLMETGYEADTIDGLRRRGHAVEIAPSLDERVGHAHAIVVRPDGSLEAGSDPRSDGEALVFPGVLGSSETKRMDDGGNAVR